MIGSNSDKMYFSKIVQHTKFFTETLACSTLIGNKTDFDLLSPLATFNKGDKKNNKVMFMSCAAI